MNRAYPELGALLAIVADLALRVSANTLFEAGKISGDSSMLFFGNVHHPNGIRAFGFSTIEWMLLGLTISFALYVAILALSKSGIAKGSGAVRVLRFAFFVPIALAILNGAESMCFGRVTDYFGIIHSGTKFFAFNLGDLVLWLSLVATPIAASVLAVQATLSFARRFHPRTVQCETSIANGT